MTISTTTRAITDYSDLEALAAGTRYQPTADDPLGLRKNSFGAFSEDFYGLDESGRSAELRKLGVLVLASVTENDPNVRYAKEVLRRAFDTLQERVGGSGCEHAPSWNELDELRNSVAEAVDAAAFAVAAAWLAERGAIPLPDVRRETL